MTAGDERLESDEEDETRSLAGTGPPTIMNDNDAAEREHGNLPLAGKVAVVTGGGRGIGRALVDELVREQVRAVVVLDQDMSGVAPLSAASGDSHTRVVAYEGDLRAPGELENLVRNAEREFGRVDLFCSNAGVMAEGGVDVPDSAWQQSWEVNVLAHVRAARSVLPGMISRNEGMFLTMLSAAAFLTAPGAAPYTVTKHAALGFSEWLAINYAQCGIRVCAVCPEAVDTPMLESSLAGNTGVRKIAAAGQVLSPAEVARQAVSAVKNGDFLVTTHPRTLRNAQKKWADVDKWINAMSSFLAERED
ncbi:MAG TPA: SDR family oxidoreductase [Amycolatopsis sp.]|nr:SDR family oxidoreductase [Amycolatopsis sp.]